MNVIVESDGYDAVVGRAVINIYNWSETGTGVLDLTLKCKTKNTEYNANLGMNGIFQIDSINSFQIDEVRIASANIRENMIGTQFSDSLVFGRLTVIQTAKNRFVVEAQLTKSYN